MSAAGCSGAGSGASVSVSEVASEATSANDDMVILSWVRSFELRELPFHLPESLLNDGGADVFEVFGRRLLAREIDVFLPAHAFLIELIMFAHMQVPFGSCWLDRFAIPSAWEVLPVLPAFCASRHRSWAVPG